MAVAEVFLYRNATSSDATYSNSYNSKQNFPSATDLNWSVDDKVLIEWNTARDGSGSGYSVGSSINAAVNDTQGATIYYAIWETVDVIITYQGAQIATMSDTGTKTLLTSETFCEDDIVVSYTKPSSGGGGISISPNFIRISRSMPGGTMLNITAVKAVEGSNGIFLYNEAQSCEGGQSAQFSNLALINGLAYICVVGNTMDNPMGVYDLEEYNPVTYFDITDSGNHLFAIKLEKDTGIDFM